jgi:hypothetical protein
VKSFSEKLSKNITPSEASFADAGVADGDVKSTLAPALHWNLSLQVLSLSGNKLTDASVRCFLCVA